MPRARRNQKVVPENHWQSLWLKKNRERVYESFLKKRMIKMSKH